MRGIVFSDGHVGEYPEGWQDDGLNSRLTNTLDLWTWVRDLAVERKADFVLFGGDRFKPHRPPAWMRDLADARMADFRDAGIHLSCLKGNHDMYDKTGKWSSYGGVRVWNGSDSGIEVYDEPGVKHLDGLSIYFLPYGYRSVDYSRLDTDQPQLLLFHDEIVGHSKYHNGRVSEVGIPRGELDRASWTLILGGHIHMSQDLHFKYAPAYHIGTPLEFVGDPDEQEKGALVVDFGNEIDVQFVESPFPKVKRLLTTWAGSVEGVQEEVAAYGKTIALTGNVVLLTVQHDGTMPVRARRELLQYFKSQTEVACAEVKMEATYKQQMDEAADQIVFTKGTPLPDQISGWTREAHDNPKVHSVMDEIIRRTHP